MLRLECRLDSHFLASLTVGAVSPIKRPKGVAEESGEVLHAVIGDACSGSPGRKRLQSSGGLRLF